MTDKIASLCTLDNVLLSPAEMGQADRLTIESGTPGTVLMQRAGEAVALAIARRWQPCRVAVLCGPGNNGGDGFVAAQCLLDRGWPVTVFLLGQPGHLKGDAAWAAGRWQGKVHRPDEFRGAQFDLLVDALFGAGLNRPLAGEAAELAGKMAGSGLPVCAVDVPSGLDGASGGISGIAVKASLTVSFFRAKPGHWLLPGRDFCGELLLLHSIGITEHMLEIIAPRTWLNSPLLWRHALPRPCAADNKYRRGHVLVWGGAVLTGASRLAAQAARRMGAGLVSLSAPRQVWPVYAQSLPGCMVVPRQDSSDFDTLLTDPRRNACLIGPGAGLDDATREAVLQVLRGDRAMVVDADALTVFAAEPQVLFNALAESSGAAVLTPHEGEFGRLFRLDGCRLERAREAARMAHAVVVLKGSDTIVAAPDGRVAINGNAPASLATGGSGDVLAGMCAGLLAQGMAAFEAACAAVWLHAQAAAEHGPALLAEDLLVALEHWPELPGMGA